MSKDIGKLVKEVRGTQTRAEFAKALNISRGFLSELENNVKEPGKKTARKLAELSGKPADVFFN